MFNSGGMGARPSLDGLSATAFPSGVQTMPIEATEQTGPIVIWRKELRPDSGGDGEFRGGLGQRIEIEAEEGHEFDFSAMFDRVNHPAHGRDGGGDGAPGVGHARRRDAACAPRAGSTCRPGGGSCSTCPAAAASAIPRARSERSARREDRREGICDGASPRT